MQQGSVQPRPGGSLETALCQEQRMENLSWLNAAGEPVCLATDFDVLIDILDASLSLSEVSQYLGKKLASPDLEEAKLDVVVELIKDTANAVRLLVTGDGAREAKIDLERSPHVVSTSISLSDSSKTIEIKFPGFILPGI
jgi:hypothetical protein